MVTETTAADCAVFAAETASVLAITVAGPTGPYAGEMGTYKRNAEHSPTNGGNVYTKTDDSDLHFFRSNTGYWFVSDTVDMIEAAIGTRIMSALSLRSPLDLEWLFYDGTDFQPDPLLKITGF